MASASTPARWWRSHSVRVRLTLWYVGAMVVVLGVYVAAVYVFVGRNASEALNQQLRREFTLVAASLYQTPDGDWMLIEAEQIDPEADLPWVQVWRGDRSRIVFANLEAQRRDVPESRSAPEGIVSLDTGGERMRIMTQRGELLTQLGAAADRRVVIQVGRSESAMQAQLRDLAVMLVLGLPVAVAVAGVGGYALARRALEPIERMTARARTITAERLNDRLPVDNPDDEMGRLAAVINGTLGRLEQSFDQMRRFTADVSHQLRTPLTAIRSVGEVGLRAPRDEAAYRAIIGSMLEETDRLAVLVGRLLTLSRAEMREGAAATGMVDLRELTDEVVSHLGVLAEEKRQTITVEAGGEPAAVGDRVVLRQALINLLDNAIKFTPPGGSVRVRIESLDGGAVIDVSDTGPGIAEADRARIFDRFFRGDHDGAAGTGLGLSIARSAVEAMGGTLTLARSDATGSTFRIALSRV